MADINSGRNIACLNAKPGIKFIQLSKWKPHIGFINSLNEVVFFDEVIFYKYEARDINVNTTLQHQDEGEVYEYEINIDLQKIDKDTSKELNSLSDMLLIAITIDEYEEKRVYGFESGLDVNLTETSGGAKSSFSGYNLKLKGSGEIIAGIKIIENAGKVLSINDKVLTTTTGGKVLTI